MHNSDYSSIDTKSGSVNYNGPSKITPGDHSHMPSRTEAYLSGDERGHVQASSLGGTNTKLNVVPQNANVNHQGYYSMEKGERSAIKNGASIHSDKTAYVSNQPGARPDAFIVNDTVTYGDGHTEIIHHSFANESYVDQEARNSQSATLPETFSAPNLGDTLRDSMSIQDYSDLMENTDTSLQNIDNEYVAADFSGTLCAGTWDADIEVDSNTVADSGGNVSADADDIGAGADAGDDGGISADSE